MFLISVVEYTHILRGCMYVNNFHEDYEVGNDTSWIRKTYHDTANGKHSI